jgi:hypothetical protein
MMVTKSPVNNIRLRGEARGPLYRVDVTKEENEMLDLTLILTAHSQSKTQDLESKDKLVQEYATRDLNM